MAVVTTRDIRDVSTLVSRKLDLYMNLERTEDRFCPVGFYRTNPRMQRYDFLYHVLESTMFDKQSPRNVRTRRKNASKRDANGIIPKTDDQATQQPIMLHLEGYPHRVVPYKQADRLEIYANQVFDKFPIDKLQMLHRYRPSHPNVPHDPEHGKIQGYTEHVGSILNTHKFVDYYTKEGLNCGRKDGCKRLQELKTKDVSFQPTIEKKQQRSKRLTFAVK